MEQHNWILTDVGQGIYLDSFEWAETLNNPENGESADVRVSKRRLRGGPSDGVDLVELGNGRLSLSVLPTRGMGIWRGRCGEVELKWNSPNFGPIHPNNVPLDDPCGLGWLEGFDEWLVRCGLDNNGSPEFDEQGRALRTLHGRIANTPARSVRLSVDPVRGEISLTGKVYETRLFFKKLMLESTLTTWAGSSKFRVTDTVTNLSAQDADFELLYHINTGIPFASPGARVVVPFDLMAPRSDAAAQNLPNWSTLCPESPGSEEVVFFFEPAGDEQGLCRTMLVDASGERGMTLSFRPDRFPYFSFWKSRLADADGYVCGLEPSTDFPNGKSFEKRQGRVLELKPGESRSFELDFEILHDKASIETAEKTIRSIPAKGVIEKAPKPEWTP